MAKLDILRNSSDVSIYLFLLDATSDAGEGLTGLVHNTAGLAAYYVRTRETAVAITLATLAAANSAHSDGGFKEVDATNLPGVYRLDVPDAAFAMGAASVRVMVEGAANLVPWKGTIRLTAPGGGSGGSSGGGRGGQGGGGRPPGQPPPGQGPPGGNGPPGQGNKPASIRAGFIWLR